MEKEVTILTYVDHSFEQDLTFIDGLVKTRSRSFLIDPSQLEFEKVLSKYMIILFGKYLSLKKRKIKYLTI